MKSIQYIVAAVLWVALAISIMSSVTRLYGLFRKGQISRSALSAHLTADFVSLLIGISAAFAIHRWVASTINGLGLGLSVVLSYALYFGIALVLTLGSSLLYHRVVDGRIRSFMLDSPESTLEGEEPLV